MNREYSIAVTKNFRKEYNHGDLRLLFKRYGDLMAHLLYCAVECPGLMGNRNRLFIIRRGLETMKHCFKTIFLYSKDIDITFFHCKRAYCYYIEFMGQISDNSHSYLQLNSKDAVLFVYKKTLFEMNSDFKKNFTLEPSDVKYLKLVSNLVDIYHSTLLFILLRSGLKNNNSKALIQSGLEKSNLIMGKIIKAKVSIADKVGLSKLVLLFGDVMKSHPLSIMEYL